jgi:hypothetical protein
VIGKGETILSLESSRAGTPAIAFLPIAIEIAKGPGGVNAGKVASIPND